MSLNGEKVVIDIVANDNASKVFSQLANNIKKSLNNSGINKPINIDDKKITAPFKRITGGLNDFMNATYGVSSNISKSSSGLGNFINSVNNVRNLLFKLMNH